MRLESGTCNVCSAPCSSCVHLNQAIMGSKTEEYVDENCHLGEDNQYSKDECDGSSVRSRTSELLNHTASGTSNMACHDSLSENTKSKQTLQEQYQDSKCLEGLDDSTSCISRASKVNIASNGNQINSDRINISCSSASVSLLGAQGSGIGQSVVMSSLPKILSAKDGNNSDLSESCLATDDLSLTKEREPIIGSSEKSLADKEELNNDTVKVSPKISPKSEADTDNDVSDANDGELKYSADDGLHEKAEELVKSPGMPVPQPEDGSDESDVVEHDVKVCDICGDSGREDLLAICCRCSDGAEHTYCMREMLEKLPEEDWLCEECQFEENQRLELEEKKSHKVGSTSQSSGKRPSESMELAAAAKRRALESSTGSPKALSPRRLVPLSRESSFKSLDNGKVKPGQPIPSRNRLGSDDTEPARSLSVAPRSQTSRSKLLKSNSCNNFSSKLRIREDDAIPHKHKGGGEHVSKNMETPTGTIGKSMSFKSSNLGRTTISKVKMLSSKSATTQDLKGSRHAKESGLFDRKSLSRIDWPVVCSTMASSVVSTSKGDPKLTPHGETAKPSQVNSSREFKFNQDGKLSSLSNPVTNLSNKSPEPQDISERISNSVYETQHEGLPRSREIANQVDKTKDSSSDRVRSGTNASKRPFCYKCKDIGHAPDCCPVGDTQVFGAEESVIATGSSKEMHQGNRLKAAIQAALLRRPEIHRKKDVVDQTDEFPTSDTVLKCDVSTQDQVLVSNTLKNNISADETNARQDILEHPTSETSKCSSANDLKQLKTDFCSQPIKSESVSPVVRDLPNYTLTTSSVTSKMSAIPEYKYIWQGVFEVHRSGKLLDLYAGIQAHLSSCASPKVLETVNKFLPEVSLQEVSRLSTWPSQFHQGGVKEDNIAVYFFAKDIESYERHYKGLLDHMIRNDIALKGIFDGVELLIFASNQLPENSQRWNMLFFLWGIFRGRRTNHKRICIPSLNAMPSEKDFPTAVMTLSETQCSLTCMDEELLARGKAGGELLPSASIDQGHNMATRNFDIEETIVDETHLCSQVNCERQDSRINTNSLSRIPTSSIQMCQEKISTRSLKNSMSEHVLHRESKSPEEVGTSVNSTTVETKANNGVSFEQENLSSRVPYMVNQEIVTANKISGDKISERPNNDENHRKPKRKQMEDDLNINVGVAFQGDVTIKGVNCQLPNDKKVQRTDVLDTVMEASTVSCQKMPWDKISQKLEDRERSSKLQTGTGFSGAYGYYTSEARESFNGNFASVVNDFGSCSSVDDKGCKESCDEKIIHEDLGAMERTFFPVDTSNENDSRLVLNSMSLKGPIEYGDQFQVGVPNLELALGGETKHSQKGMLPFFAGAADRKNNQEKTPELEGGQEGDTAAASLSLSLSFPSSNLEHTKSPSKADVLPDGHHMNTPLLLFGRFPDK